MDLTRGAWPFVWTACAIIALCGVGWLISIFPVIGIVLLFLGGFGAVVIIGGCALSALWHPEDWPEPPY
jgi:hypothetical protein